MATSSSFEQPKGMPEPVHTGLTDPDDDAFELSEYAVKRKWQGTEADRREMSALGRVQQLRVSSVSKTFPISVADNSHSETSTFFPLSVLDAP